MSGLCELDRMRLAEPMLMSILRRVDSGKYVPRLTDAEVAELEMLGCGVGDIYAKELGTSLTLGKTKEFLRGEVA